MVQSPTLFYFYANYATVVINYNDILKYYYISYNFIRISFLSSCSHVTHDKQWDIFTTDPLLCSETMG